jgi:hypothetical protein
MRIHAEGSGSTLTMGPVRRWRGSHRDSGHLKLSGSDVYVLGGGDTAAGMKVRISDLHKSGTSLWSVHTELRLQVAQHLHGGTQEPPRTEI